MQKALKKLIVKVLPPHPVRRIGDLEVKKGILSYFDQLDMVLRGSNGVILDLGSGGRRLNDKTLNLDVVPAPEVDVLADGEALPFKPNSLDCVVVQQVLQYVCMPDRLLAEVKRTLKSDGLVFLEVPFLFQKNESRQDFWRWTREGLALFSNRHFKEQKSGVSMGGGSAISTILRWTMRVLISGGEKESHR